MIDGNVSIIMDSKFSMPSDNSQIMEFKYDSLSIIDKPKILAKYLNSFRQEFQTNKDVLDIISSNMSSEDKKTAISDLLKSIDFGDVNTFSEALNVLFGELTSLVTKEPSKYLVDTTTGQIVKKLEESDIFTPDDYINENGEVQKSIPKVRPEISVAIALKKASDHKNELMQAKLQNPEYKFTYEHIREPDSIVDRAVSLLTAQGIIFAPTEDNHIRIVFGNEHVESEDQSINPFYHRSQAYSSILSSKIMKMISSGDTVWILNLEKHVTSKTKFYSVDVFFKCLNQLE